LCKCCDYCTVEWCNVCNKKKQQKKQRNNNYSYRVWKGILGIRDLTKIRCGIRENEKYLDGIRDLTATREAGFAKILGRNAEFCCLSVGNSENRHDPNKRYGGKSESTRRAQNINRKGQLLQKLVLFHVFLGKKKRNSGSR